jgi:hypothetical protein
MGAFEPCASSTSRTIWAKVVSWPNGMKLSSERWLEQLLTQFPPGCDHQRKALGAPFLDARLHPMGACRVHDSGS